MATELADAAIEIDIFSWQFNFTNEYHFSDKFLTAWFPRLMFIQVV